MSLTRTVVGRPTTIAIVFALLVGFGLYTITNIAIDLYPEITPPVLVVSTSYAGAGPEEVEKVITRPLESVLSNVTNLKRITSTSSEGSSMLILEFTYGTDMAEAANSVRDNLEFVKDALPEEAGTPMIFKFNPSIIPILRLTVEGNRSQEELRKLAEDYIAPRLEQTEGVAMASVSGGRIPVVRVDVHLDRLEAYGITLTQIATMLRTQNVQLAGGRITENRINYLIRTAGEFQTIEEISRAVVGYKTSQTSGGIPRVVPVLLRDVADVSMGYRSTDTMVFVNGKPSVSIAVLKQSGTNSVQVADRAKERIAQIQRDLPRDVKITITRDTTESIRAALSQVSSSALNGAILAMVVLFLFLRSVKPTLIVGLAIPISVVIALAALYFAGITLNLMTLTGLALGIGMLVDNSIVILENIFRYREKGAKPHISAILGTQEMITAITASTLTTVAVFLPIAIFQSELETIGELFADLAFTVVISLLSSLAVALLLVPVLSSHYLPLTTRKEKPLRGILKGLDGILARFFSWLEKVYGRGLSWTLRHRKTTILAIIALFILAAVQIPRVGFEYLPEQEADSVSVQVELPLGTSVEVTRGVLEQLQEIVKSEVEGYQDIMLTAGEGAFFGLGGTSTHRGSLTITLPEYSKRIDSAEVIEQKLRAHFKDFPNVSFTFSSGNQGGMGGSASPIDILVKTDDYALGKEMAYRIRDLLAQEVPEATEPRVDLQEGLPQVEVIIDRERAYALGLNVYQIGQEIEAAIDGITASRFREGGSEYDILVSLREEDKEKIRDLERIFLTDSRGNRIPLSSVASFRTSTGPTSIQREDQTRTIHVLAGLAPGATIDKVEPKIRALIAERIPQGEGVVIEFSGDYQELIEYGTKFVIILLVAVFLVFGIMASQFESFLDPFIILFTIPLSLIGIVGIYLLTGEIFSLFTAVGLVILAGIVVNNGIVLVDYTNLLRKRNLPLFDACVEAGKNRLRPVLMTTLTTVLGLTPLAFTQGEGMSLIQPIAQTVVGGLSVSTLFTLFLIPVIYSIFNQFSEKRKQRRQEREAARRAAILTNGEVQA
ncbi:acriflavin resistance protein [Spirochaeta thermophila DSM 6578]|uniref:Acriflavin resistance protein n=1 Tax=Winmispira thermophila (strain ATCC 700085 / DSM 6578 / Z-1203) TaxID=869211 RepID=G0GFZ3_WINT7|nr:efflux RND transporter permease subunit [Spirochaeta thermophila]AEJ62469.1 acriflavin resistance protein [Spirochaeta thermophila DSM 6578]